jgi:hypothetical protein
MGAFDRTYNGGVDAFVAKLQIAPVMHVGSVHAGYKTVEAQYEVGARIGVLDSQGAPVIDATVTVELVYPDGAREELSGRSGSTGTAVVQRIVGESGTYTFNVLVLKKPPFEYDPTENVESSDSVTIP